MPAWVSSQLSKLDGVAPLSEDSSRFISTNKSRKTDHLLDQRFSKMLGRLQRLKKQGWHWSCFAVLIHTEVRANHYSRLEKAWSNSVFIQISFCRKCNIMKPQLLSSVETSYYFNPEEHYWRGSPKELPDGTEGLQNLVVIVSPTCLLVSWSGLFDVGNSGPQQKLHNSHFLQIFNWMKLVCDLGILQQAFIFLCIPRWLDN